MAILPSNITNPLGNIGSGIGNLPGVSSKTVGAAPVLLSPAPKAPVQGPQPYASTPATQTPGSQFNWIDTPQKLASYNQGVTTPAATSTASTTTISNGNKINQAPSIVANTGNLSKVGITTDAQGNATYANGTVVQPPAAPGTAPLTPTNNLGTPGISQGGYIGDVYYAPGSVLPTDGSGQPLPTTQTSPTDDLIIGNLNAAKSQVDAQTATQIDGIQASFAQLISQQQQANTMAQNTVNNALLMGGVTGGGSSAQFAPISSSGVIQSQVNYGIQQISSLQSQENTAILAAQKAGQDEDFQLMEQKNTEISNIRDQKVAAAQAVNDQITAQNQKLADQNLQMSQDSAVAQLYQQGITDVPTIISKLQAQGINITADQAGQTLQTIEANDASIKDAQSNLALAQQADVTTPYVNQNGKVFDAATGKTFATMDDFLKAAGVSSFQEAYDKGLLTDVTNQTLQNITFATGAAAKYPDAGIMPTDTPEEVANKLQNSSIYRKDTYIAPSSAGSESEADMQTQAFDNYENTIINGSKEDNLPGVGQNDPYANPATYNAARENALENGYSAAAFDAEFSKYINPKYTSNYEGGGGVKAQ